MFQALDLSQVVPPHTVQVTLRYRLVRPRRARTARVWITGDPEGREAICLADDAGVVTLRLQVPQRLYVAREDPRVRLSLWVVECIVLRRSGC